MLLFLHIWLESWTFSEGETFVEDENVAHCLICHLFIYKILYIVNNIIVNCYIVAFIPSSNIFSITRFHLQIFLSLLMQKISHRIRAKGFLCQYKFIVSIFLIKRLLREKPWGPALSGCYVGMKTISTVVLYVGVMSDAFSKPLNLVLMPNKSKVNVDSLSSFLS